jgi:predicted Zn-dependent peptidase
MCVYAIRLLCYYVKKNYMQPFTKHVLKNGMRVILAPQKESVATTILVLVEAGSKYEKKENNGLSHFLEHMCFKGTTKRPKAIDIAGELDGLGAEYNAFTSQEWTGYYAKVQANDRGKALDIISDLYLNPVFNAAEIEKEKGVVIEELNMYEDTPQRKVQDLFLEVLYGDQPAGWDVGGRKEVIQKLGQADFLKYRSEHYVAQATAVVVAGAFEPQLLISDIEKMFAAIPKSEKSSKVATDDGQAKPQTKVKHKTSDQTHLVIGCRAFRANDPRRYALDILTDILGGGMSSRLFQRIREQMGAAYYVRAGAELLSDHGYFEVSAGVDHGKLEKVITAILEELTQTVHTLVPEHELARAKNHLAGRLLLGLETSDAIAMYYGGQEVLRQEIVTPAELLKHIEQVTAKEVQEVAQFMFRDEKLNLALIGPYKSEEAFTSLLKFG